MLRRDFLVRSLLITGGLALGSQALGADADSAPAGAGNVITLPPLPYAEDALAPLISAETVRFHYGKHHQAYVDGVNRLRPGTAFAQASLTEIILKAEDGTLLNQAQQVWNHTFYWHSMRRTGGAAMPAALEAQISKDFGSVDAMRKALHSAGMSVFGSGWVWLVYDQDRLQIITTANADCPLRDGKPPILVCDVWEHAYYIDHRNKRAAHLDAFLDQLVNWDFAAANLAAARPG